MDSSREQLSALVDNELDDVSAAVTRLLAAENRAERQRWSRYHLIGEVLRDGSAAAATADLGARISAAIDAEPPLIARPPASAKTSERFRLRPAHALAASLAAVGVLGVLQVTNLHRQGANSDFAQINAVRELPTADHQNVSASELAEQRRRLNSYIVNFNEQRDSLTLPKLHPYVRIVGFHNEGQP